MSGDGVVTKWPPLLISDGSDPSVQHLVGPLLCALQQAQDARSVARDAIGCNAWRSAYDQFASTFDTTKSASLRKRKQLADLSPNPVIDNCYVARRTRSGISRYSR